jgi:hypothetical protein
VQFTGIPVAPAAGGTYCVTVTGAAGPLAVKGHGAATVVSVTPAANRVGAWVVCFTLGAGPGTLVADDGAAVRFKTMRGR